MLCVVCNQVVNNTSSLKCTGCGGCYHINCLNLAPNQIDVAKPWLCSFCTSVNTRRRRNDLTPIRGSISRAMDESVMSCDETLGDSNLIEESHCDSGRGNHTELSTPPNVYTSPTTFAAPASSEHTELLNSILLKVSDLQTKFLAIQTLQSDINKVKSDVSEMRNSLNIRLDEFAGRIETIEAKVSALEICKPEIDELKGTVKDLEAQLRTNEQWVRRSNIQINGIPETKNENLNAILSSLAQLSGYPLNIDTDIDFVTRVAVKNDKENKKPKPIIVRLQARYKKDDFISSLRKLKNLKASDLGFAKTDTRVYINDHLSAFNKYLLREAQARRNQKQYKYCWVRNCAIQVRKTDDSPILYIASVKDLNKIT